MYSKQVSYISRRPRDNRPVITTYLTWHEQRMRLILGARGVDSLPYLNEGIEFGNVIADS